MIKILAFDPSLRNLGVAFGISTPEGLQVEYSTTFYIDKLVDKFSNEPEWDVDDNTRRAKMLHFLVERLLHDYRPHQIVIEEPIFNGKNPNSLQVQMKAITVLEVAALSYESRSNLVKYMPNVIKLGVGITDRKKYSDKNEVTKALLALEKNKAINFSDMSHPNVIDEHAVDAVAMLFTKHMELMNGLY